MPLTDNRSEMPYRKVVRVAAHTHTQMTNAGRMTSVTVATMKERSIQNACVILDMFICLLHQPARG